MRFMTTTAAIALICSSLLIAGTAPAQDLDVKALYDKKCKVCHSIGDDAGKMADKGGPLDGVGSKRDAAWLEAYLRDPKSKVEGAKMPALKYTDEELAAFVEYMLSLK
jgi:nitric oxide reductase subunit C